MNKLAEPVVEKKWPFKLLDEQVHARLVDNLEPIAKIAGISVEAIDMSMKEFGCTHAHIDWVKKFHTEETRKHGGMLLLGKCEAPITNIMIGMTAAFLRNYIDARLVDVAHLLPDSKGEMMDSPTVLLVPDFVLKSDSKKGLTLMNWQSQFISGFLMSRFASGKKTILYASDEKSIAEEYGESTLSLLRTNWQVVKGK